MRRKNTIRIAMLVVILTGAFFVLRSAAATDKNKPCKESIDECYKKNSGNANKTIWEGFSQQFFSSI